MKRNWIRILAIVLALACLIGTAAATGGLFSLDINGDGIQNIWDAQTVILDENRGSVVVNAFLGGIKDKILGTGKEEVTKNGDYYEIDTVLDLYQMAKYPNQNYKLVKDIDLGGAEWTPIVNYTGTFDGNGKTIRNFTVTQEVANKGNSTDCFNIGFFGDCQAGAVIKDLHLENFVIDATDTQAQFVGGLIGTNRGAVSGCTVDGRIIDGRGASKTLESPGNSADGTIFRGILVGRNAGDGTLTLDTMTVQEQGGEAVTVNSVMALKLYKDTDDAATVEAGKELARQTKFTAHGSASGSNQLWRDTSYSTDWETEQAQAERAEAVDTMYKLGTIKWQTQEELSYTQANAAACTTYYPGVTYTGLPYNNGASSLDRVLSKMDQGIVEYDENNNVVFDSNHVYKLQTGLGNAVDSSEANGHDGFGLYVGTDCSTSVGVAWSTVSHSGTSSTYQGFTVRSSDRMVPGGVYYYLEDENNLSSTILSSDNTERNGMVAVGGYPNPTETKDTPKLYQYLDGNSGLTDADYEIMVNCIAQAQKGDALVVSNITSDENTATKVYGSETHSGHARMVACDPVVIRNAANDGKIDRNTSYVVIHEQGWLKKENVQVSGNQVSTIPTSWRTYFALSMEELMETSYIPVTINAFHDEDDSQHVQLLNQGDMTIAAPDQGQIFSHYRVISSTLKIYSDAAGANKLYEETGWAGVGIDYHTFRGINQTIADLSKLHEGYATKANLVDGQTYYFSIELRLSNGRLAKLSEVRGNPAEGGTVYPMSDILSFTYDAP